MGVPAFYRWLSEKYPKTIQDVLEERVHLASSSGGSVRAPFDATLPNPSGLETDNLYIDMNGIIHPCSHPEHGPQPSSEPEMYENVCLYIDRLMRAVRPRKLLYLAIDGVAPRAKMNQQRSRRHRAAQEIREREEIEAQVRGNLEKMGEKVPPPSEKPWDSNVITPGTKFMFDLSEYVRFYIRRRISDDKAWRNIKVIFSDASIPGEGEHKIMAHVRQQRGQKGYNPNLVHVLHGLDADLIMLALATHEAHFYILREEVVFGRRSMENNEKRREETGFSMKQKMLDEAAGSAAMELPENSNTPLQRLSIPVLREYLANEFASVMNPPFKGEVSFERLVDDIVFLCFFVGNDFLPHIPSLDIRDGGLDFLFNVYRRILPALGDYLTDHGGKVNLARADVILAEVGAIEDQVFEMKHYNQQQEKLQKEMMKQRGLNGGKLLAGNNSKVPQQDFQKIGRSARIMAETSVTNKTEGNGIDGDTIKLQRGYAAKESLRKSLKHHVSVDENAKAAQTLKQELRLDVLNPQNKGGHIEGLQNDTTAQGTKMSEVFLKRKATEIISCNNDEEMLSGIENEKKSVCKSRNDLTNDTDVTGVQKNNELMATVVASSDEVSLASNEDIEDMFGDSDTESIIVDEDEDVINLRRDEENTLMDEAHKKLKGKIKALEVSKLDDYAKNVKDNVRLHEPGWKDRYYTDKCKADDVKNHGGREHLFRSYVKGLCWVMKYYYEGCPSWKWFYPFHYAPFASDLRNIERFQKDCDSFDLNEPFKPVEQLLAVLPEDSSHAVPKESRWLMSDKESPIIDFYPKDIPTDPNGKAMPWLWVVLLPFIDEERLLSALHPTMKKWSQKELLYNTQGLDDGYVYLHKDHHLAAKLKFILASSDEYSKKKFSLEENISRVSCFFGLLRKPLSNEVYDFDNNSIVPLPATANKISRTTELFASHIEPNEAVCFAFTEPSITSHRSEVLRGAVLPSSILTDEDKRIRCPSLNRGGKTMANLGGSNKSHLSGYGSMNISSYERDLATKTGRGRQMDQAGTRPWGTMEPIEKRHRYNHATVTQLPTIQRWQSPLSFSAPPSQQQQWIQKAPHIQYQQGILQHHPQHQTNAGIYNQQTMTALASSNVNQVSQQQWQNSSLPPDLHRYNSPAQLQPYQLNHMQQLHSGYNALSQSIVRPMQNHTSFSFRSQSQEKNLQQHPIQPVPFMRPAMLPQVHQPPQVGGKADLGSLRAQLMSTIQKNREHRGS